MSPGATGQVDDLEARDEIALLGGAVDVDGSTIPHEAVAETVQQPDVERQRVRPPIVAAAGSWACATASGWQMTSAWARRRCGAAVVGIAMAQDDPGDAAEPAAATIAPAMPFSPAS